MDIDIEHLVGLSLNAGITEAVTETGVFTDVQMHMDFATYSDMVAAAPEVARAALVVMRHLLEQELVTAGDVEYSVFKPWGLDPDQVMHRIETRWREYGYVVPYPGVVAWLQLTEEGFRRGREEVDCDVDYLQLPPDVEPGEPPGVDPPTAYSIFRSTGTATQKFPNLLRDPRVSVPVAIGSVVLARLIYHLVR